MAALVVVNSDCSKLSKAAIKKAIRNKLTTITIYTILELFTTLITFHKFQILAIIKV